MLILWLLWRCLEVAEIGEDISACVWGYCDSSYGTVFCVWGYFDNSYGTVFRFLYCQSAHAQFLTAELLRAFNRLEYNTLRPVSLVARAAKLRRRH